jgi:hypothetical protein
MVDSNPAVKRKWQDIFAGRGTFAGTFASAQAYKQLEGDGDDS